jgi:YidC/Oxa1 family membrane protein insertase
VNIFELLIVQPIFNILVLIYSLIGDFGISLIIFTVLIRFAMWPLVKRQLHQTKAMRKLQPELKKIKARTKGNKQLESMQMMELYKKHGVSPFRSIGMLIIQLPIFIALYQVIQIFTLHRDELGKYTYDFIEHIPTIHNIIASSSHFNEKLFGFIDLTQHALGSTFTISTIFLFLIAIGAAILQYIMSKQTMPQQGEKKRLRDILAEAADGKQADQSEMNAAVMGKMIKFLPFIMLFVMLNLPGALALYYATSNVVAVFQQRHVLKQDEEELDTLADKAPKTPGKKATAKAREKQATEANVVTRIKAKDTPRRG